MTNRLALILTALALAALIWDQMANGGAGALYLFRAFFSLLRWLAFWR